MASMNLWRPSNVGCWGWGWGRTRELSIKLGTRLEQLSEERGARNSEILTTLYADNSSCHYTAGYPIWPHCL